MKYKTSELSGNLLNLAVAKADEIAVEAILMQPLKDNMPDGKYYETCRLVDEYGRMFGFFSPATSWSDGGPIIERERISILHVAPYQWVARIGIYVELDDNGPPDGIAESALIAAMRAFVKSRLGEEVDL